MLLHQTGAPQRSRRAGIPGPDKVSGIRCGSANDEFVPPAAGAHPPCRDARDPAVRIIGR
ncbi:hypothetical protein NWFMUON74_16220 [Nocardia wallacei]|uniref:Uncharacterized protein n=1 Tax=Nocardia wallacei TaxID=480035 RepID=A0A7G1KFV1_9NOCA|nr:hypothetical protein NWFMUON74_16220 [Nocardia wallacei]